MKRVIVNADDFGLSAGVTRGIVEAYRDGVLTSTTMMANQPGFDDAVRAARENPELPIGVHLTLLWGPPVANPALVSGLLQADGNFPTSLTELARRYATGRLRRTEVETEFRAQIQRIVDAGIEPTHLDTHKHVHGLAGVLEALIHVATEFGIDRVRLPYETRLRGGRAAAGGSATTDAKVALLRLLTRRHRSLLRARQMRTTDQFVGIAWMDRLNLEAFRFLFDSIPDGITELMCHPGYDDPDSRAYSRRPPDREGELRALLDPETRAAAEAADVEFISYNEV